MAEGSRTACVCWIILGFILGGGLCSLIWAGILIWHPQLEDSRRKDRLQKYTYEKAVVVADNKICSDVGRYVSKAGPYQ